ncbi:MAG: hypothetical protein HWN66_13170 [Candidatus Helarchaeota archaeon]|nr:hypothetical protein [Candidatus Helarchaeota archaeon]
MSEVDNDSIVMIVKKGEEEKKWHVKNPSVKIIIRKIPFNKIPEKLEAYILMGDTVMNYAAIQTSEETIEKWLGPHLQPITELPEVINQKMNLKLLELKVQIDALTEAKNNIVAQLPDTIKAQLGEQVGKLEECTNSISSFAKKITKSQRMGELGEEFIMTTLVDEFNEISFALVRQVAQSTDIKAKNPDMIDCLIEVKNYTNTVPTTQVDKFWRDLDTQNVKIGCFISLWTRLANIGEYKIVTKGDKLGIFMNVSHFSGSSGIDSGIKLAFFITRQFARYLKKLELERMEESILRQRIKDIQTEMDKMEEELEKISNVQRNLTSIQKLAKECSETIEDIFNKLTEKITKIMKGE